MTETTDDQRWEPPSALMSGLPTPARVYDYWLGGKDNYPVDQEAGEQYAAIFPGIIDVARVQRYFLARAVRFLAGEAASASSSTWAPACQPWTTPTRSPSERRRAAA